MSRTGWLASEWPVFVVGVPCFAAFWVWELRQATQSDGARLAEWSRAPAADGTGEARLDFDDFIEELADGFMDHSDDECKRNWAVAAAGVTAHLVGIGLGVGVGERLVVVSESVSHYFTHTLRTHTMQTCTGVSPGPVFNKHLLK